ncbi:CBS domain-containing protein [uncultured Sphingomonas sp.]|uniref:CBS domain-containing protein n=1 Tax=uncultured Sphingomonas sp. TaxID=158754 RepID=UPI0025D3F236|nr:CBS domain-containing protein [uncultured Sphingomonas sp.]
MTIAAVLGHKGREVATVEPGASLQAAAAELARRRIGALLVMEGGQIAGILSERDIIGCLAAHGADLTHRMVGDAMTADVITVEPSLPVLAALALITRRRVRHLPVVDGGALVGIVSIGDLVKFRMERIEAEADAMRAYIQNC